MHKKFYLILLLIGGVSCVPISKFNELKKKSDACTEENSKNKAELEQLQVSNTELKSQLDLLSKDRNNLIQDTLAQYQLMKQLQLDNNKLEQQYHDLQVAQENLTRGNARETTKLLSQLQSTQEDLQKREDQLRRAQWTLDEKRKNLDSLTFELDQKNKHMKELEGVLNRKDSVVKALKAKVSDALLGFENNGLTVRTRNGKVYVSLEDKLLFKSGSYEVNQSGVNALKKLAKVLEQNQDINVMIEGHTDDVPYRPEGPLKDNWDLSVKRATTVVRILLEGTNIDPKRLTAAGRSQYAPIDKGKTTEARQKNRRTEIILTPKLDELFKILNTD
ncbi:MAG TPA: OmpA family protein [Bacteroidales bacterium]